MNVKKKKKLLIDISLKSFCTLHIYVRYSQWPNYNCDFFVKAYDVLR